ncbi:polysaccharide biosynthesis C-terminal domain-containing protein, partial [Candidatus Vampirococcus lugosii]
NLNFQQNLKKIHILALKQFLKKNELYFKIIKTLYFLQVIIALFLVLKVLFQLNFVVINAYGKPKNRVKIIAFVVLVNILINGALILFIGVYGAVISSIIACFIIFLFSFIYIYKKNPIKLYRGFIFGNLLYFVCIGTILYVLKGNFFEYTDSAGYENLFYLMIAFAIFGL